MLNSIVVSGLVLAGSTQPSDGISVGMTTFRMLSLTQKLTARGIDDGGG